MAVLATVGHGHQGSIVPAGLPFSPGSSLLLPTPREVLNHTLASTKWQHTGFFWNQSHECWEAAIWPISVLCRVRGKLEHWLWNHAYQAVGDTCFVCLWPWLNQIVAQFPLLQNDPNCRKGVRGRILLSHLTVQLRHSWTLIPLSEISIPLRGLLLCPLSFFFLLFIFFPTTILFYF